MGNSDTLVRDGYRRVFSRAAALLSESGTFQETLEQTLLACLPELGDFGFFDACHGDEVVRVARAPGDEETEALLRTTRWVRQARTDLNLCALSSGSAALHRNVDDAWYVQVAANEAHLALLRRLAFRSMVTVPMRNGESLIGALTLFMGRSGRRHDAEHLALAIDLAGLASPVVANAALVERYRAAEKELHGLRDRLSDELDAFRRLHAVSTRVIRREDRLEDLLQEILDAALQITGRERGSIRLVDEAAGVLRVVARKGFRDQFYERFGDIPRASPMASALAWRTGNRVLVGDLADEDAFIDPEGARTMLAEGVRALQCTPLVSRDGRIIGVFTTHSPVPEEWGEAELRLLDVLSRGAADLIERAQSESMLKEADRRKDQFLAILAHELRNPLAPIRYAVSLVRAPGASPAQRRDAEGVIERQVEHMSRLLDDLLDVSRIERGTVHLRRERLSVRAVVDAAHEASRPLIESRGHALHVSLDDEALTVEADAVRLTQILTNLLNNAARYTDAGGRIELSARAEGGDLVLAVKDNGVGIAPEVQPRLFTLFSQGDAMRRSQGGLGIGLALVRGFVALHGGSVEARSAGVGQGSEFVVRLPREGAA